ncbi:hypothetical protein MTP99_016569 [Tenebrio molitor]|nr:hypothetical protein MTP99_016569 [Tenebrio molitor]
MEHSFILCDSHNFTLNTLHCSRKTFNSRIRVGDKIVTNVVIRRNEGPGYFRRVRSVLFVNGDDQRTECLERLEMCPGFIREPRPTTPSNYSTKYSFHLARDSHTHLFYDPPAR